MEEAFHFLKPLHRTHPAAAFPRRCGRSDPITNTQPPAGRPRWQTPFLTSPLYPPFCLSDDVDEAFHYLTKALQATTSDPHFAECGLPNAMRLPSKEKAPYDFGD